MDALRFLAAFSVFLFRGRHPYDQGIQVGAARILGGQTNDANRLVHILEQRPSLFIWPEQLVSLSKYVILWAQGWQAPPDVGRRLFEVFLAFNSEYDMELDVGWARDEFEHFLPAEVRSTFLEEGNVSFVLDRYHDFIIWSRSVQNDLAVQSRMDIDALMLEALGLTYEDYAAATLSFISHFSGAMLNGITGVSTFEPVLDIEAFLAGVEDQKALRGWLDMNSAPLEDIEKTLVRTQPSTSAAALYRLAQTPILQLAPGRSLCLALPFLHNVVGTGLFFRLNNYLQNARGSNAANQFRSFFGKFLEHHVRDCVERATIQTKPTIFGERPYGKPKALSTDVVVFEGDTAVFIEINAKRFNVEKSVLALERDQIMRDLQKMIVNKALQTHDRIADFQSGKLQYPEIDKNGVRHIIALVVTNQGVPRLVGFNKAVTDALRGKLPLVDIFDFVDLQEMELLPKAFAGDCSLADLLVRKAKDPEYGWQSLTNFLYARHYKRLLADPQNGRSHSSSFQSIMEAATKWGFKSGKTDVQTGRSDQDPA